MTHESRRRQANAGGCTLFEHPLGLYIRDEDGDVSILPREALKELLPWIQMYVETGKLPEPRT